MIILPLSHYRRRLDQAAERGRRDREAEDMLKYLRHTGHSHVALLDPDEAETLAEERANRPARGSLRERGISKPRTKGTDDETEEQTDDEDSRVRPEGA